MQPSATDPPPPSASGASDELFRLLLETVRDYAIFMLDPDGRVISWNEGARRIKGYEAAEVIGRHVACFYAAGDVAAGVPAAELARALRDGRMETRGWRLRKDGSGFWADIVITAVYDPAGRLTGFGKITRDVTARLLSEERFRTALRHSPIGLALVSPEGAWLEVNPALLHFLGYTEDELMALTYHDINLPEYIETDMKSSAAMARGEINSFQTEKQYRRKDGSLVWAQMSASLVRDENGDPLYFIAQVEDIGERKRAEAERDRLNERITLATQAGQIGIWEWDIPDDSFIWDRKMYELNGLDPETPGARRDPWPMVLHPDDRQRASEQLHAAVAGGAPFDTEYRVVWRNGEIHHIRVLATVIRDAAGAARRVVGTNWDITEIRTLSEQLLAAKLAAEQANRAKSEFLTVMSHELRTPLNGILGFAQLLDGQHFGPLNVKQKEFVDAVLDSGGHLLQLIAEILELSKIEAGRMTVSIERVDVLPVMKSVVATLTGMAEKHSIALDGGDFGARLPALRTDRVRLAQALLNLGSNAIKYNRPGGRVTFACAVLDPQWVRLSVTDTGFGIPEHRKHELFQPFNRLDAPKMAIDGTGVGLALTRRLVELMGGRVGFTSTHGEGSCFWLDLPIADADATPAWPEAPAGLMEDAARFLPAGFSVLYVEDNPANLNLMRHVLGMLDDARLIEATDAASALAAAAEWKPDVIVLDINLPDLNGYALLRALRRLPGIAQTPILALTANAMPSDIKQGLEAGFFRYLTKPLVIDVFLAAVKAALPAH